MSKIKNFDLALYESIESGLREVAKPYKRESDEELLACTYSADALEQMTTFLCLNNIQHTFTICPINSKLKARVAMVTWTEKDGEERNLAWWEETNG